MPVIRIAEFDIWRPGYADATVSVKIVGTDTLADIFTDEAMSEAADNPQTLITRQDGDILYGKFEATLYTSASYYLDIDTTDQTGIVRPPLVDLIDIDASEATVQTDDGSEDHTLASIVGRIVHVFDFGEFLPTDDTDASAATNNATLEDAIGAVSSGGVVMVPPGTYAFEDIDLPSGVIIQGQGPLGTILQSQTASDVLTFQGEWCGLRNITIDGVSLEAGSNGILIEDVNSSIMDHVIIKRFGVGIYAKGGMGHRWVSTDVEGCTTNAKLHGDGAAFWGNQWSGACRESVEIGVSLEYVDAIVAHNKLSLNFEDNAATALKVRGARYTDMTGSAFANNDVNLDLDDFVTGSFEDDNTLLGLWLKDFSMSGGEINMTGDLADVVFERGLMSDVDVTLTTPGNAVLARDVIEDSNVTISGDGTKWLRWKSTDHGASSGITTNNTATKAWSIELDPGQRCYLIGVVIGNAKTSDESGEYHISVSARRPPSTLAYDSQTGDFTTGLTVTGATSGATALAVSDTDGGATGTLEVRDIVGAFVDNEILTDSSTGSATVNGTLTAVNAELLSTVEALRAAREDDSDWNATFVANGPEIELRVTGDTSKTVEWLVHVDALVT